MDFEKEEFVNISKRSTKNAEEKIDVSNSREISSSSKRKTVKNKKKKVSSGILATRIISGILSFILVIGGVALILVENWANNNLTNYQALDKQSLKDVFGNNSTPIGEDDEPLSVVRDDSELLSHPNVLNIMLFGADQYGEGGLSDTMILVSIDSAHGKIKLTSFLRDTYIYIPGVCSHKLNYAYTQGGAAKSIQTIEANYGVKIDRYATVNFSTFREIVDVLGGVEVEVSAEEIRYINAQLSENGQLYDENGGYHYLDAYPGKVKLDGYQALWYARNRGGYYGGEVFSGDDWDRTDRQRKFISAIIEQCKGASISELVDIVNLVGPMVTTDIKKEEITNIFLKHAVTFLSYDIEQTPMPSQGNWYYGWNEVGSVILVDSWNQARRDIADFIYGDLVKY